MLTKLQFVTLLAYYITGKQVQLLSWTFRTDGQYLWHHVIKFARWQQQPAVDGMQGEICYAGTSCLMLLSYFLPVVTYEGVVLLGQLYRDTGVLDDDSTSSNSSSIGSMANIMMFNEAVSITVIHPVPLHRCHIAVSGGPKTYRGHYYFLPISPFPYSQFLPSVSCPLSSLPLPNLFPFLPLLFSPLPSPFPSFHAHPCKFS